jgi:hypothetical protein
LTQPPRHLLQRRRPQHPLPLTRWLPPSPPTRPLLPPDRLKARSVTSRESLPSGGTEPGSDDDYDAELQEENAETSLDQPSS